MPGTTWVNEMHFVTNHAPGAGSIAGPVDQLSSELRQYHGLVPRRMSIEKDQELTRHKNIYQ